MKSISQSKKLSALNSHGARLLFSWLIPHLDKNGCFFGEADVIKGLIFTRLSDTEEEIELYLQDLETCSLIIRYTVDGDTFLNVPDFIEKQPSNFNPEREGKTTIPPITQDLIQNKSRLTPPKNKIKEVKVKEKGPKLKFTDAHMALSILLKKGIEHRLPKYKIRGNSYKESWPNEFRIMIENKEATESEIRKLIVWIFQDSDWWYKNILSASKFRKQFGRLWEEMEDDKPKRDTVGQAKQETTPKKKSMNAEYVEARMKKEKELNEEYKDMDFRSRGDFIQSELAKWTAEYYKKEKKK